MLLWLHVHFFGICLSNNSDIKGFAQARISRNFAVEQHFCSDVGVGVTRNVLCLQENTFDIYVTGAIILFMVEYIVGIFFDMVRL